MGGFRKKIKDHNSNYKLQFNMNWSIELPETWNDTWYSGGTRMQLLLLWPWRSPRRRNPGIASSPPAPLSDVTHKRKYAVFRNLLVHEIVVCGPNPDTDCLHVSVCLSLPHCYRPVPVCLVFVSLVAASWKNSHGNNFTFDTGTIHRPQQQFVIKKILPCAS